MSREWKPGVLVIADAFDAVTRTHEPQVLIRTNHGKWSHPNDGTWDDAFVRNVRPLVVIDPEQIPHLSDFGDSPTDALKRIADDVRDVAGGDLDATEEIIRWLAELIAPPPPKPEEPTGLGAVVEDAEGNRWVRAFALRLAWTDTLFSEDCREYADIDAVRVLSEGVAS